MASISLTAHSQTSKDTGVGSHVSCEDLTSFSEVLQMFLLTEFLSTRRSVVENSGLKITVIICLLNCNVRFQNLTLKKVQVGVCFLFPWIPYVLFPPKFMLTFPNLFLYFLPFGLKQGLTPSFRMALNSKQSFCVSFPSAGIKGMRHCTQLPGILTLPHPARLIHNHHIAIHTCPVVGSS